MFCWPSLHRCQVLTRSPSLNLTAPGSSSSLFWPFLCCPPKQLNSTAKPFCELLDVVSPAADFPLLFIQLTVDGTGKLKMHLDISLGMTLELFELSGGMVLLSSVFFFLKMRITGTFIADHKVPRRQRIHFSRLVVKQYSYLCSWISSFFWWENVSSALLVSKKLKFSRNCCDCCRLHVRLLSVVVICPHLLVWHLTGWEISEHVLGLQVSVWMCMQLDPVWCHLQEQCRLPGNLMRVERLTSILLCQRKECSKTQIDYPVFGLTRESFHLV